MSASCYTKVAPIVAAFLIALSISTSCVTAFSGPILERTVRTSAYPSQAWDRRLDEMGSFRPSSSLSMYLDESSEWYVEPAPRPRTTDVATKLPDGAVARTRTIESKAELLEFLNEDDRLCVIKFHASWCKSCQKFGLHFSKLAARKADWVDARNGQLVKKNDIRIASIEWSKSEALCKSLGITKLPTVQLYSKGRRVAQVSVPAKKFSQVENVVNQFVTLSGKDMDFAATVEQGAELIKKTVLANPPAEFSPHSAQANLSGAFEVKTSAARPQNTASQTPLRRRWWVQDA